MRVLVNDIAASSGGAKSILLDFYRYLVDSNDENEWYFLLGEPLIEQTDNIHVILLPEVKRSWFGRLWFDAISGRKLVASLAPDVILSFQNTAISCGDIPQYVYVHQPLPFQKVKRFSFLKREEQIYAVYQYLIGFLIKRSVSQASGVFVQTRWMAEAVADYTNREKILVVTPAIHAKEDKALDITRMQYNQFFYPAGASIYKNHAVIYGAVQALAEEGVTDFQVDLTLEKPPSAGDLPEQIDWVGMLPRSEVMDRYTRSILIFPSYIETFGLPLAEARLMKGIVLAADTPFAREILDGYENAWFFEPFNVVQLKELMKKAICGQLKWRPVSERSAVPQAAWADLINALKE